MLRNKLLITLFSVSFIALTATSLEAKSHSHFSMRVNVGEPPVRHAYVVHPAPVYLQPAPVVVQSAPVYVQRSTTTYQTAPMYPQTHLPTPAPNVISSAATPAIVPTPVAPPAAMVTTTTTPVVTEYYTTAPTYVVPAQPIVIKKAQPAFHWGFNWGFCFR